MGKEISDEKILQDAEMFTKKWARRFSVSWKHRDELKQEISLALLEARERFDPDKAKWSTYSDLRSRGAAIDWLRKQIPYTQRNILMLDAPPPGADSDMDNMLDYLKNSKDDLTEIEVMELLDGINERYRKIILWMIFGYQQREIAKKLGLSEDRVWELTKIIRQNLAREK